MEQQGEAVSVETAEVRGVQVLRVSGEIDMGTSEVVRQEVLVWLDTTTSTSVLDLSGVTFLSSSGLALLIEAAQHAQRCGTTFVIVAGHRAVLRALRITNLDEVFTVPPDLDRAVDALRGAAAVTTSPE